MVSFNFISKTYQLRNACFTRIYIMIHVLLKCAACDRSTNYFKFAKYLLGWWSVHFPGEFKSDRDTFRENIGIFKISKYQKKP